MSPIAPGTSSQNAGRNVTIDGVPSGRPSIHSTSGVIASPPKNPLSSAPNTAPPMAWPP